MKPELQIKAIWEASAKDAEAAATVTDFALGTLRVFCLQRSSPETEKTLAIRLIRTAIDLGIANFVKDEDRFFQLYKFVFERASTSTVELCKKTITSGILKRNRSFYVFWISKCLETHDAEQAQEAIKIALANIPSLSNDPEFSSWGTQPDLEKTEVLFAKPRGRRSSLGYLAMRKLEPIVEKQPESKPMRIVVPEIVLNGNSFEEYLVAFMVDQFGDDMEVSIMEPAGNDKPVRVKPVMAMQAISEADENGSAARKASQVLEDPSPQRACSNAKKMRQSLGQSPGGSFTTNLVRQTANMFSETITFPKPKMLDFQDEESVIVPQPRKAADFEVFVDQTIGVGQFEEPPKSDSAAVPSPTLPRNSAVHVPLAELRLNDVAEAPKKSSFEVYTEPDVAPSTASATKSAELENAGAVSRPANIKRRPLMELRPEDVPAPPAPLPKASSACNPNIDFLDYNEPTVSGPWVNRVQKDHLIMTSSPISCRQNLTDLTFLNMVGPTQACVQTAPQADAPELVAEEDTFVMPAQAKPKSPQPDEREDEAEDEEEEFKPARDRFFAEQPLAVSGFARRRSIFTGAGGSLSIGLTSQLAAAENARSNKIIQNPVEEDEAPDLNATGVGLPDAKLKDGSNPWDLALRQRIMQGFSAVNVHEIAEQCSRLRVGSVLHIPHAGESYRVDKLIGQGGYARVFRASDEVGKVVALKYEVPSCAWEAYCLSTLRTHISVNFASAIMRFSEMYVFPNASLIVDEFLPYGNLLECINETQGDMSPTVVFLIFLQLAKVLREVHTAKFIHGDVKPDNVMLCDVLPTTGVGSADDLLKLPLFIRLIDWGRSIHVGAMHSDVEFFGPAGTKSFDCPEMLDGRPWTYQTDFYTFAASIHVALFKSYATLMRNNDGTYAFVKKYSRRKLEAAALNELWSSLLNIASCKELPSWNTVISLLTDMLRVTFNAKTWPDTARRHNNTLLNRK